MSAEFSSMPEHLIRPRTKTVGDLPVGQRAPTLAGFLKTREDGSVWIHSISTVLEGDHLEAAAHVVWVTKLADNTLEADVREAVAKGYLFTKSEDLWSQDCLPISKIVTD
jgi:hypothetical protein